MLDQTHTLTLCSQRPLLDVHLEEILYQRLPNVILISSHS